jgi:hypothetical protein
VTPQISLSILQKEFTECILQIDRQMREAQDEAVGRGISLAQLRHPDGTWVINSLLSAKVQALHGLTLINTARKG